MLTEALRARGLSARRVVGAISVTAVSVALGACAATDRGDTAPKPFRTLISRADIARLPEGSPDATVLRLWRYAQLGNTPDVVALYHPRVQAALGHENIAGAYAVRRTTLVASRPRIVTSEPTAQGQMITLKVTSTLRAGQPIPAAQKLPVSAESFLLRKRDGRWVVTHDSILESALTEYRIVIEGGRGSVAAVHAGRKLAERYRDLFLADAAR